MLENVTIFPTAQAAVNMIANEFLNYSLQNRPVHISLSGGSTPKQLFKTLATSPLSTTIHWKNLHFWWGDERMVSPDDPESNYGEAQKLLFDHITLPIQNIHRIRGEAHHQQEHDRFEKEIRKFVPHCCFDWIILGMGDDGHTASLFPGQTNFEDEALACLVQHPQTGQWRLSKTARLLSLAKRITFLVTGEKKAKILTEIANQDLKAKAYPAAKIRSHNGKTEWYLDKVAASGLTNIELTEI